MARQFLTVHCPCCGQKLTVDLKLERAFASDPVKERPRSDLDDAIREAEGDKERLEGQFKDALDSHAKQKDHLEKLFDDARKKAEKEKGRPPSPFDLE